MALLGSSSMAHLDLRLSIYSILPIPHLSSPVLTFFWARCYRGFSSRNYFPSEVDRQRGVSILSVPLSVLI